MNSKWNRIEGGQIPLFEVWVWNSYLLEPRRAKYQPDNNCFFFTDCIHPLQNVYCPVLHTVWCSEIPKPSLPII